MLKRKIILTHIRKVLAVYLALCLLFQIFYPSIAHALTSGPSQPEVQSFEPAGTSEMVSLFTGDFSYNIPLIDVDGYPINISYHSGITMDQEASWVGLGWNINPGVINRNMRGIPDDFKGDEIIKEYNTRTNKTYGLKYNMSSEIVGAEFLKLGSSIGIRYNNYTGLSMEKGFNMGITASRGGNFPLNANLGIDINSSSEEGLTFSPSVSLAAGINSNYGHETSMNIGVGLAYNSRAGLRALTINYGISSKVAGNREDSRSASSSFDMGTPTYTPEIPSSLQSFSMDLTVGWGGEIFGTHPNAKMKGYYAEQKLQEKVLAGPAYGYMFSEAGSNNKNSILDFNREKDGQFNIESNLPVTNFTYDIYSVSGQGTGGSYRPFRGDMGHVFDPFRNSTSENYSAGVELGTGNLFHGGSPVTINESNASSGKWEDQNPAAQSLKFKSADAKYETFYFKEANEKNVETDALFNNGYTDQAQSISLKDESKFNVLTHNRYNTGNSVSDQNTRLYRSPRNQNISHINNGDYAFQANDPALRSSVYKSKSHHIAEITSLGTDGSRYVYGIPAYNLLQHEVTFAVGPDIKGAGGREVVPGDGMITYDPLSGDNTINNKNGIDNYYSNTILPPYAHSYLLTAVLSPDYIDNDGIPGPSPGDNGKYTKFNYTKVSDFKWRTPVDKDRASLNEGLKTIKYDDKASYIYGEKEVWYLASVETKNQIALFDTEVRKDARGVIDKNGGIDGNETSAPRKLNSIRLFSQPAYKANGTNAVPLKQVCFNYDYSLCPGVPNHLAPTGTESGKLTLKSIYFKYQNSNKGRLSPYEFIYGNINPGYDQGSSDRWGNYKPDLSTDQSALGSPLSPSEFPYVEQAVRSSADAHSSAWHLSEILLPSGGKINVQYESDDYGYVQNKLAGQMFKIVGIDNPDKDSVRLGLQHRNAGFVNSDLNFGDEDQPVRLMIDLQNGENPVTSLGQFYNQYLHEIEFIYFRFLMNIKDDKFEYISGYFSKKEIADYGFYEGGTTGWIDVKRISTNDKSGSLVSPMTKAGLQFSRQYLSNYIWDSKEMEITEDTKLGDELLILMRKSSFFNTVPELFRGPNQHLYYKEKIAQKAVMNKSWIRLKNPNGKKAGGGLRVKRIEVSDEWAEMTNGLEDTFSYGQEYSYNYPNGTSSGVANYEPILGGEENPLKIPIYSNINKRLAPDDEHYQEEPFGESFFPSPGVGYGMVTVKNLPRPGVSKHATGKTVHEFFTAKDFPIIVDRTKLEHIRHQSEKFSIKKLFKNITKDYLTASQGYSISLNDMHGKAKSIKTFQEGSDIPMSSIEYKYKSTPYGNGSSKLINHATIINQSGMAGERTFGVTNDFVADMRQQSSKIKSVSYHVNVDGFFIYAVVIPIPTVIPEKVQEITQFRSAGITKVNQRFGILEEVIAKDNGSVIRTKNLAYDSETGEVLLTETVNDFDDPVFSLKFPAYWYYHNMGPAYRNTGSVHKLDFNNGSAFIEDAKNYFIQGDELSFDNIKLWILKVHENSIDVSDYYGSPVTASGKFKVTRSGYRNRTSEAMASITTMVNPLAQIGAGAFDAIINVGAMDYSEGWRSACECLGKSGGTYSTNPYIMGTRGCWKPNRSYTYLSELTASIDDQKSSDIRRDGMFKAFSPFYKLNNGEWERNETNWTFAAESMEYNYRGEEIENKDALGIYASAVYGYNQSVPVAVAANARYKEVASDNFEDYKFNPCADNHFKFKKEGISNTESHSGKHSLLVRASSSASLTKQLVYCDICDLQLAYSPTTEVCKISGGTPPYTYNYKAINGFPNIGFTEGSSGGGGNLIFSGSSYTLVLTVKDSKDCSETIIIKKE